MDSKNPHRYDDMLSLPPHRSEKRPRMPMRDRAAQFLPYAPLTGNLSLEQEREKEKE